MIHMRDFNAFEAKNVKFLVDKQVAYATIQITETGFKKSILDATTPVRAYFLEKGIHDYDDQLHGPEHKKIIEIKEFDSLIISFRIFSSSDTGVSLPPLTNLSAVSLEQPLRAA